MECVDVGEEESLVRNGRQVRSADGDSPPGDGNDPNVGQRNNYELSNHGHENSQK